MFKTLRLLAMTLLASFVLAGCGGEKADIQKDAMDPQSLKATENPPPGMPGMPAKGTAPGAPAPEQSPAAQPSTRNDEK